MSVARNGPPTDTGHKFRVTGVVINTVSLSEGKLFALFHDFQSHCHRITFSCRGEARERPVADIAVCQDTQVSGLRFIGC
jgi:hypothetical protein